MTALVAMAVCAGGPIGRDALARRFRPDAPLGAARADLRRLLHRTRAALPDLAGALAADDDALTWTGSSDVQDFLEALRRGDHAEALRQYGSHFLAGVSSLADDALDDWVDDERVRWRLRWRQALAGLLRHGQDSTERLRYLRLLVDDDPHDEDNIRLALSHAGDPAEIELVLAGYETHRRALALDLGVRPSDTLSTAAQSLRAQATVRLPSHGALPLAPSCKAPAPNAPRLIGRDGDLARVRALLEADHPQVVTLCGPGGVGKTELALHLARRQAQAGEEVIWVDLLRGGALGLLHGMAQAIALPPGHEITAEAVLAQLATRRGWVVLDNAERLGNDAHLLQPWVLHAPHLRWLATSRVPLGIGAETVHRLSGLPAHGPASEALALLALHAERQGQPDALQGGAAGLAQRVVQLVEGLPLAIELAATWLPLMSIEQLLRGIEADFGQLTRGVGKARQGHESLQAVFEGSWALLDPDDRRALGCLGLFEGAFGREDAWAVAGCDAGTLLRLLSHSLIVRQADDVLHLHAAVRQFARDKLATEDLERAAQQHADLFLGRLLAGEAIRHGHLDLERTRPLLLQLADLVAAWSRAGRSHPWTELEPLLPNLLGLLTRAGQHPLLASLMDEQLKHADPGSAMQRACRSARAIGWLFGEHTEQGMQEVLSLMDEPLDHPLVPELHIAASYGQAARGRFEPALAHAWRAEAAARERGDPLTQVRAKYFAGNCAFASGQVLLARTELEGMLALAEQCGSASQHARAQVTLGEVLLYIQPDDHAVSLVEAGAHWLMQQGDALEESFAHRMLATARRLMDRRDGQLHHASRALDAATRAFGPFNLVYSQLAYAQALVDQGRLNEACPWFAAALTGAWRLKVGSLAVRALIGLCRSDTGLPAAQAQALLNFVAARPETRPWERRELVWTCAALGLSEPATSADPAKSIASSAELWASLEQVAARWL